MARVVYKYPFPRFPADETLMIIQLPLGARPVFFSKQAGRPTVWVEQDQQPLNEDALETWDFVIRGTGHPLPAGDWRYVGSFITPGGSFVFHCYARLRP